MINNIWSFDFIEKLDFENINGFVVVDASINGEFGKYIFDTGASVVYLNGIANKKDATIEGVNMNYNAEQTLVQNFSIGTLSLTQIEAYIIDLSFVEKLINIQVKGLIGGNILKDYVINLDYDENTISFYKDFSGANQIDLRNYFIETVSFVSEGSMPIIEATLNGTKVSFGIDTGASLSILNNDFGNIHSTLQEFKIGRINIKEIKFESQNLSNLNESLNTKINGILSPEILNVSKLIIDYKRSKVSFFWSK
jgi:hypothetical protein